MSSSQDARAGVGVAFDELHTWVQRNGWAGFDPYDIRGQGWYVRLFGAWVPGKLRTALFIAERALPQRALRKVLRVKPEINAKGMGLLASAYLARYRTTNDSEYLQQAGEIFEWLGENACSDYPGASWGYPFHWQSRIFIPRGTPSVVVTGTVGFALLEHYRISGDARTAALLDRVAEFFVQGLNRPIDHGDHLCFSYTPLDQFTVLNASLFAASFLAQYSVISGNKEFEKLAIRAVNYVVTEQNADGSFYYWGSEPPTAIDHFHTGFVLRFLDDVRQALAIERLEKPIENGYAFYKSRMFTAEGLPRHTPTTDFPINIHSIAEAIICLSQFHTQFGHAADAMPVFDFARRELRHREGWYVGERRRTWHGTADQKVPFMRWAQAWMLLAFARLEEAFHTSAGNGDS